MSTTLEETTEWTYRQWIDSVLNENWKLEGGL